jgi:methylenetetrahydrofolate dehydrogenase (NADP+)/methenyltetrahydrofolate cyclohydrolase
MLNIKEFVVEWKEKIKARVAKLMRKPVLVIVQMGNVEASNRYVRNKVKDANEVGIDAVVAHFEEDDFEAIDQFKDKVTELALDCADGIIVQLPLPQKFNDVRYLLKDIPARLDVDGLSGKAGAQTPCTPLGMMTYINEKRLIEKAHKRALVIGRSELVGRPMAKLLLDNDYTVTVAHSKSGMYTIQEMAQQADLVVCAVGKEKFLDCTHINGVVMDVGINFDADGKMCGDCYIADPEAKTTVDLRSPVPGGVGLLTRCALMENTVRSCEQLEEEMRSGRYEITIREPEQKD